MTNPPLSEMDFEQALAGEASPKTLEHLRHCPVCRSQLARIAGEEALVRARLFRAECPSTESLGEWQMGLLPAEQTESVVAHLSWCPWCQNDLAMITEVLQQPLTVRESLFDGLRRLTARRVAGGASAPFALALRGGAGDVHSYQAADLQLTLATEPVGGGHVMLVGLLTRAEARLGSFAGRPVQLFQHQHVVAETMLDDLDNFTFDSLTPGQYELAIPVDDDVFVIPDLVLKSA